VRTVIVEYRESVPGIGTAVHRVELDAELLEIDSRGAATILHQSYKVAREECRAEIARVMAAGPKGELP